MTQSRAKGPPRSETVTRTRLRIIEAARAVFSDQGIEAATTRAIAEQAGCNEVTLFRHFETKQKLLAAVVQDTSDEFYALCCSPENLTGDLRKDLRKYAEVYDRSLQRCEGMCRALIGEGRRRPTLAKELIGDVLDPFHHSLSTYLKDQIRLGKVGKNVKTEAFAEIFTAMLMGGLLRRTSGLSKLKRENWLRESVDTLLAGIAC